MSERSGALAKVEIISLETDVHLTAQYNPKEIQIEKSATWNAAANSRGDRPDLEYTSSSGRSLSMELMFDTFEDGRDVHREYVDKLIHLITVMNPDGREERKRPPRIKVLWGNQELPPVVGVLESVNTKYTMFLPGGRPVRATCSVKVREADPLGLRRKAG